MKEKYFKAYEFDENNQGPKFLRKPTNGRLSVKVLKPLMVYIYAAFSWWHLFLLLLPFLAFFSCLMEMIDAGHHKQAKEDDIKQAFIHAWKIISLEFLSHLFLVLVVFNDMKSLPRLIKNNFSLVTLINPDYAMFVP